MRLFKEKTRMCRGPGCNEEMPLTEWRAKSGFHNGSCGWRFFDVVHGDGTESPDVTQYGSVSAAAWRAYGPRP